jgi:hypothetical protein
MCGEIVLPFAGSKMNQICEMETPYSNPILPQEV